MKKIQKGKPGYLNYKRKVEILRTVIYFAIVLAIFALGYWLGIKYSCQNDFIHGFKKLSHISLRAFMFYDSVVL